MKYLILGLCGALLVGCDTHNAVTGEFDCRAARQQGVRFVEPLDGGTVPEQFSVVMAAGDLDVQPAGTLTPGTGHLHILIDAPMVGPGQIIPADEQHRHYGDGSLNAELELLPGDHILRLQFADGAHRAYGGGGCRDEIRITVRGNPQP